MIRYTLGLSVKICIHFLGKCHNNVDMHKRVNMSRIDVNVEKNPGDISVANNKVPTHNTVL